MENIDWSNIRNEFPLVNEYKYFDSASFGLISNGTADVSKNFIADLLHKGEYDRKLLFERIEEVKKSVTELINGIDGYISLVSSFTVGFQSIVSQIKTKSNVLILENDYPVLFNFWKSSGHILLVHQMGNTNAIDYQKLRNDVIQRKIDILAISHVNAYNGVLLDLGLISEICSSLGILVIVDATQSVGHIPIDVSALNIDILICSCYKWCLAGFGIGFLYVSKKAMKQLFIENPSYKIDYAVNEFQNKRENFYTSKIFEYGHYNYSSIFSLGTSIDQIMNIGIENIHERNLLLSKHFYESIEAFDLNTTIEDKNIASGIFCLKEPPNLKEYLQSQSIKVAYKENRIRISINFYNNAEDINYLIDAISSVK